MLDKAKNVAGQSMPYLRNVNVRWGAIETSDLYTMRFAAAEAARFSICDGDVLVCEGGEPGRCAVWKGGPTDLKFQKAIHRIRPGELVLSEWVALFLRHEALHDALAEHLTGTTIKHLPAQALSALRLPIPPLSEQRRIVARIEALFARTRRARADLERIKHLGTRYEGAILDQGVKPDTSAATLGDFTENTLYGPRFAETAYVSDGGVPTIRTTDMDSRGRVVLRDPPRVNVDPADLARWQVREGDLLVTRTGSIGRCAVAREDATGTLASAYLIRIRLDLATIRPRYALFSLMAPSGQEYLKASARAVTQPNINAPTLMATPVRRANLAVQDKAVATIDRAMNASERVTQDAARALALLDRLEQSILARAFRGELVSQDPADEPARLPPAPIAPHPRRRAAPSAAAP